MDRIFIRNSKNQIVAYIDYWEKMNQWSYTFGKPSNGNIAFFVNSLELAKERVFETLD